MSCRARDAAKREVQNGEGAKGGEQGEGLKGSEQGAGTKAGEQGEGTMKARWEGAAAHLLRGADGGAVEPHDRVAHAQAGALGGREWASRAEVTAATHHAAVSGDPDDQGYLTCSTPPLTGDALQAYAAKAVWEALENERMPHRTLVKIAGYILGEFGHTIAEMPGSSAEDQLRVREAQVRAAPPGEGPAIAKARLPGETDVFYMVLQKR